MTAIFTWQIRESIKRACDVVGSNIQTTTTNAPAQTQPPCCHRSMALSLKWRLLDSCCCLSIKSPPPSPTQDTTAPTMSSSSTKSAPRSEAPIFSQYAAENFVQGAGVAIFHIASARVVVCSAVDRRIGKYYFLPKGRRDAGEDTRTGAEREGFEEV